jgi:transposase
MEEMYCKRCGASRYVKAGKVRGLQRYRCGECGYFFTNTPPHGKPASMKALAVLLYALGNASFGMIARLLGVSDVAVMKWIRAEARSLPEPVVQGDLLVVTLDEMWHFVQKKTASFGSGAPTILCVGEPWPGCWAAVMMQPASACSPKSVSRGKPSSPTTGTVSDG